VIDFKVGIGPRWILQDREKKSHHEDLKGRISAALCFNIWWSEGGGGVLGGEKEWDWNATLQRRREDWVGLPM